MGNTPSVVLKNLRALPGRVPNDGTASVRVEALVFSQARDARIESVILDLSTLGVADLCPMALQPGEGVSETAEGLYAASFPVPLMCDPGRHDLVVSARASDGGTGTSVAVLNVTYARPDYPPDILAPENQAVMDRVGGVPASRGNRVEALTRGSAAMARRMSLIRQARKQINLQVYNLTAEGLCGRLIDALLLRASEGVEVNLILNMSSQLAVSPLSALRVGLDKLGKDLQSLGRRLEEVLDRKQGLVDTLKQIQESFQGLGRGTLGVNVILAGEEAILGPDRKQGESGRRSKKWLDQLERDRKQMGDREGKRLLESRAGQMRTLQLPSLPLLTYAVHEKIHLADAARAIVGGRNLEDKYFTHWMDLDLYLEGPVVGEIQAGFLRNWESFCRNTAQELIPTEPAPPTKPAGPSEVRFVQSRPWQGEYATLEVLVTAFQMARERIFASSQYLVLPDSLLRAALVDAAERGVEVVILTNSYTTGLEVAFSAGHHVTLRYCEPLLEAGVRIYETLGPEEVEMPKPYMHAKQFLVDGVWAAVGSFNLSMRSCFIESENLVVVQDPAFAGKLEADFRRVLARYAREMTRERLNEQKERFRNQMAMTTYLDLFF